MFDKFHDECGVFGIHGHPEAANLTYLGLHGLQHRGQESGGIATTDGQRIYLHRQMGLVADIFDTQTLARLPGALAIGHVRYSTAGRSEIKNAQPFAVEHCGGSLAIAHNGNLVNARELRRELEEQGSIFHSSSDSEVIIHLLARSAARTLADRLVEVMPRLQGAYSLLLMDQSSIVAARDPYGFRPLVIGRLKNATVFSSETCALQLLEADYLREVEPGEVVAIDEAGLTSQTPQPGHEVRRCIFEHIYFARPDSMVYGESVYGTRKELGRQLAREAPVPHADVVIPVPDSGVGAALGFAQESGRPYEMGLIRSHYVGRTFIEPQSSIRHFGVKLKLSVNEGVVRDKVVVVVDDSLVRGTTSRKIVKMLRAHGAREVHMRISCPPTRWPCFYGIDTPTRKELIASSHSPEEITRFLTSDSLGYLTVDGMHRAFRRGEERDRFCDACFTGRYPVAVEPGRTFPRLEVRDSTGSPGPRRGESETGSIDAVGR